AASPSATGATPARPSAWRPAASSWTSGPPTTWSAPPPRCRSWAGRSSTSVPARSPRRSSPSRAWPPAASRGARPPRCGAPEAALGCNLCCGCSYRADLLGGFRYLDLQDRLGITELIQVGPNPQAVVPGTQSLANSQIVVADQFRTRNQFYGGQLGTAAE